MTARSMVAGVIAAACAVAADVGAQGPAPTPRTPRVAASSFATVEVHVNAWLIENKWDFGDAALTGPSRIAISYGQPHARGRQVAGTLVPFDSVWRLGANFATTLHTDLPIAFGALRIPRGDYSLFARYTRAGWELIVNRETGVWGHYEYDRSKDVGRVALTRHALAEPEESLSIYLVPESSQPGSDNAELRGTLRIKWGRDELTARWRVDH